MKALELLAPARNVDIGFAAIDCGADAVYIGGPAFGARQAAGNSAEDIGRLCEYAHRFGVRVFATVNTLLEPSEIPQAQEMIRALEAAGVDALIVQDPAVLGMSTLPLHASTQCAIRSLEKARQLEGMGFSRLVLERELSLGQIRRICEGTSSEIECFVHGALCVCYSGECYLSEYLTGRSANRGECAQPCRSLYDLEDSAGQVLARNKALLSLKDFNLLGRLEELAGAGVMSFKIEGRLKNESYVRNVVRAYSQALDALVECYPERYRRSSFGRVQGGFTPALDKTFNRGYTELFLDGRRGQWSSLDAPKSMGEFVGTVARLRPDGFVLEPASPDVRLSNGDGFAFTAPDGTVTGFRADVCDGLTVRCKAVEGLRPGLRLYRNVSAAFERGLEAARPVRELDVQLRVTVRDGRLLEARAVTEDGRSAHCAVQTPAEPARDAARMRETLLRQLGRRSDPYAFRVVSLEVLGPLPFMGAAFLNGIRRALAAQLSAQPVHALPLRTASVTPVAPASSSVSFVTPGASASSAPSPASGSPAPSLASCSSAPSGAAGYNPHLRPQALMRSKYCVRWELGLCPRQAASAPSAPSASGPANPAAVLSDTPSGPAKPAPVLSDTPSGPAKPAPVLSGTPAAQPLSAAPLFLRNGRARLRLDFDCPSCEMTVTPA